MSALAQAGGPASVRQTPLTCHGHTRPVVQLAFSKIAESGYFVISACKGLGSKLITFVGKILDGIPVANFRSEEIVNHLGGSLNSEWLELNLGQRDWSSLTELSLPHCGLTRVSLPSTALPKLMSLDLTVNQLLNQNSNHKKSKLVR